MSQQRFIGGGGRIALLHSNNDQTRHITLDMISLSSPGLASKVLFAYEVRPYWRKEWFGTIVMVAKLCCRALLVNSTYLWSSLPCRRSCNIVSLSNNDVFGVIFFTLGSRGLSQIHILIWEGGSWATGTVARQDETGGLTSSRCSWLCPMLYFVE